MPGRKFIRNSEWGISLLAGCEVGSLVLVELLLLSNVAI